MYGHFPPFADMLAPPRTADLYRCTISFSVVCSVPPGDPFSAELEPHSRVRWTAGGPDDQHLAYSLANTHRTAFLVSLDLGILRARLITVLSLLALHR